MAAKNCPLCGKVKLLEIKGAYKLDPPPQIPGGTIVIPDASWQHCEACGEDILSLELEAAIEQERYRRLGLLCPRDIRRIREKTGLSGVDISNLLGVGDKTFTRWENGHSIQTKASDTLIRLIDANADVFALLDAEREPSRATLISGYFTDLENLKGSNRVAMAAHGADMSTEAWEATRKCIRAVCQERAS